MKTEILHDHAAPRLGALCARALTAITVTTHH
jgi:hypothetical protein